MEGNCINEKLLCNCDSKTPTWLNDTGLITNKNLLPITSFNYGPLKYDIEEANVQIGKLKCSGLADSLFGFMHPQLAIGGGPSPQSLGSSGGVIVMKDDVHQNSALKLAKSMKMSLRLTFKVVLKRQ